MTNPAKTGNESPSQSIPDKAMAIIAQLGGFQKDRHPQLGEVCSIGVIQMQGLHGATNELIHASQREWGWPFIAQMKDLARRSIDFQLHSGLTIQAR